MKVFVAGLSRSGKTSRSQHAACRIPNAVYVSVSGLLQANGGVIPVKTITDCLANQRRAVDALRPVLLASSHQLIDGHALVETTEGPVIIPDWFFDELAPDLIVYVCATAEEILSRRRPSAEPSLASEIAALSMMELAACERTAVRLNIELVTLAGASMDAFVSVLQHRLK